MSVSFALPENVIATQDVWHGFIRHRFPFAGTTAWLVAPTEARPGNPWAWCMEFPEAFTLRCAGPQLLEQGVHYAHIELFNNFGSPAALQAFNEFHALLVRGGLAAKAVLIGLSRGGFSAYRWASENPEKVAVIYGDAPLCDFKSWPLGKGRSKGSAPDWEHCRTIYGFASDAEALAYRGNPVDVLAPLADAGVALIHVVGDADSDVPVEENTAIVEERYRRLGGTICVIHKPGAEHHPHGLDDPSAVVDFILRHLGLRRR